MSYRPIIISSHLVIISSHHDIISSHHVTILTCVLDISQIMSMVQFFSILQSSPALRAAFIMYVVGPPNRLVLFRLG